MRQVVINAELVFAAMCLLSAQQSMSVQAAALNQSPIIISPLMPFDSTMLVNNSYPDNSSSPVLKSGIPNLPQLSSKYSFTGNYGENLFLGSIQSGDRLLASNVFIRFIAVYDYFVTYDTGYYTISHIRIYNHNLKGASARASILSGGVGYSNAIILFQTQYNYGFKFTVQIYGH
ncbi:uncharacterized protein [Euwallacea similis]|uniref:uncharacterized protein n=1 Tax=Euwallacea similis TaxID=1736056 RepID=UPI00344D676B